MQYVKNILIENISDFPNHPYKVIEDDKMQELVNSIKKDGIIFPVIVREKEHGKYEMISGHRRKKACMLANIKEIPCIVKELTDDEATILMVNSNIQREEILPSEKAFAYKMMLESQKHQGIKQDISSVQTGQKSNKTTRDKIANEVGESSSNIRRYIRLTNLIKELLDLVDNKKIAMSPAIELSYLKKHEQKELFNNINFFESTPSYSQAIRLRKLSESNDLTACKIEEIMSEEKPNQIEKIKINSNRLMKVLPKNITGEKQIEDFIIKCIENNNRRNRLNRYIER